MKRIIVVLIMILATISVLAAVPVFAEETTAESESVVDTIPPTDDTVVDPSIKQEAEGMYRTILSNLGEWFYANKEFIASIGSGALMLFCYLIATFKNKNIFLVLSDALRKVHGKTEGVYTSQEGLVNGMNALVDGYNAMKADFEKLKETDAERTKMTASVLVEVTTLLEMMQTAYANNRNVPQSFKDIINARYAHCMKLVDSDEDLHACVVAVKHSLEEAHTVDGGGEPDGINEV